VNLYHVSMRRNSESSEWVPLYSTLQDPKDEVNKENQRLGWRKLRVTSEWSYAEDRA
jgi:hypothetical protein